MDNSNELVERLVEREHRFSALDQLKRDLEGWREVLLPLNGLINWERPYYPAIIVGLNTFIFALIWYFEPSVLTTFSLIGLTISLIDFLVPLIGPNISSQWTGIQQRQYEDICVRILNAKTHFANGRNTVTYLKTERPKMYFLIVVGALIALAWIGSRMDNLCMTYFLVNLILLIPGIRRHGIFQKYFQRIFDMIRSTVVGKGKKMKTK